MVCKQQVIMNHKSQRLARGQSLKIPASGSLSEIQEQVRVGFRRLLEKHDLNCTSSFPDLSMEICFGLHLCDHQPLSWAS